MKKTILLFLGISLFFLSCQPKRIDLLDVGIPLTMAEYRKEQVSDVVYGLSFDIPEDKTQPIPSKLKLELQVHDLSRPLYLDFNADASLLKQVMVNGSQQEIHHQKEHLIISEGLQKGNNVIEVLFSAGEQSLNRNEDYLYTLLVPERASTLFPCFDQPNIKANYILDVTAPKEWKVLCGATLENKTEQAGKVHYQFAKSDPMSTYLFSMVAGKFESFTENPGIFDMTFLYRESDTAKVRPSLPIVYDLHQRSIDFLQGYTEYEFPFQKLDFAAIPGFQYGGMEHVGAIQYRESSLFLDASATERQHLGRAKLIAHETAHMWFGDLVTMDWFNDVWMKEVFANFMADKIINPTFPDVNHQLQFMTAHYRGAYAEDRTRGTNPIRQQLDNLKNAGSLYGGIIYNKAPIMMRQLEAAIGETGFREGIREYISRFAYGNATWKDLVEILDDKTPNDLKKWSEVWVNQSGRPIFDEDISYENEKIKQLSISQRAEDGSGKLWPQSFEIALVYPDSVLVLPVSISDSMAIVAKAAGKPKPEAILYNSNAFGYGIFPMGTLDFPIIQRLEDEVARGHAYLNTYENILSGAISPKKGLDFFAKGIQAERNELIHGMLCGQASGIFWSYLTVEERNKEQPLLEKMLWKELTDGQHAPNIKKNLFGLWKGLAYSDEAKAKLFSIWNKAVTIRDLKLNEDDFTDMAMTLALFGHKDADNILDNARAQLTNPDKLKRFDFLRPALSSNESERDAFFVSLSDASNREKESWVLTACGYVHHPLRQESAIKHLPLALELLEEIQKTGDIFFPKGWLSNTVGQYQSQDAYSIVERYLAENPNLNESLQGKLLQATDDLYRFVEMREDKSID
ncbi:peptidase M1 [Flagellimonas taeanensis]|uniref:M1 family metallopeptidase n=1 Tax=Flavobacteriaceae TaxID=49546 RepID=UPI000E67B8E2|nr:MULTISPECIES: M1 family aminopeptidase [Allomuricauda]MDC6385709.1 M1 family aminopeptidase [Muricauda sp. SK9]RIV51001.1 peptidase M1 [Allomuricauda taeanensis]